MFRLSIILAKSKTVFPYYTSEVLSLNNVNYESVYNLALIKIDVSYYINYIIYCFNIVLIF